MKPITSASLLSFLLLSLLAACSSSHPSASDATGQISTSFCERLQSCFPIVAPDAGDDASPTGFAVAFPGGVPACASQLTAGAMTPSGQEACSQSQLDACTADIQKTDCAAFVDALTSQNASGLPSSCQGC